MANFKAWVDKSPRTGNFTVRYRDGKTKLPNGHWKVFTEITIDKSQRIQVDGQWKTAKVIAEELAQKLELRHLNNLLGHCDFAQPIDSLVDQFITDTQNSGSVWSTVENYERELNRTMQEAGIMTLSDLSDEKLRAWRDRQLGKRKPGTISGKLGIVVTFTHWLMRKKIIKHFPFDGHLRPAVKKNTPRYYTDNEWEAVDKALAKLNPHARLACNLAFYAGLRKIELVGDGRDRLGVLWEDLTWNVDGTVDLFIRAEVTKGGKKSRFLRLAPEIVALLGSRKTGPLIALKRRELDHIFFVRLRPMAGLKKGITIHGQRHSFAKNYLEEGGMDLGACKEMLGHTDIKTTQIYASHEKSHLAKGIAVGYTQRQLKRSLRLAEQMQGKQEVFGIETDANTVKETIISPNEAT